MKKITSAILLLGVVALAWGQNPAIPKKVSNAFKARYASAKAIQWFTGSSVISVDFRYEGFDKTATFKKDGTWIKTISDIPVEELTGCFERVIGEDYSDYEAVRAKSVENPKEELYYISLERKISEEEADTESNEEDMEPELEEVEEGREEDDIQLIFSDDCDFIGKA